MKGIQKEDFGLFLKEKRRLHGITLEQLSEGLCSVSGLVRIEDGTRIAGKALQDALLYRLGISPDVYENFLFADDYTRWRKRQQLLYAVTREEPAQASAHLREYREQYEEGAEREVERRLERQFCLSMEAQILRNTDVPEEADLKRQGKLEELFREALGLTAGLPVPASGEDASRSRQGALGIRGKIYSVQELNLLLEVIRYGRPWDWEACIQEILCQAEDARFDSVSRAKLYPKAAYYLCREGLARGNWGLAEKTEAIALCGKAVSCLREVGRLYYLWELLGLLGRLIQDTAAGQRASGAEQKAEELEKRLPEYMEWRETLEAVYGEFHVPRETRDFCWLYVEKEVYCINEVIRNRREMLGISRKQLCENGILCSEKTLRRLEEGGRKIQKGILTELMGRLNLSAEYCQTELVTSDPEALELMCRLREAIRNWESEQTDLLLEQIRERISLEIPVNRQIWMECHLINEVHKGNITGEQAIEQMREILAITLPYEIAVKTGGKYLTNKEIKCIQNMVCWNKHMNEEMKMQISLLEDRYQACERNKVIFCFINMYEVIMSCVASKLGNMGEYNHSDEISLRIVTECLYQRIAWGVHGGIYGMMWNDGQRQKKGIPILRQWKPEEDLEHCIVFSMLDMDTHDEKFYRNKLKIREQEVC